MGEYKLRIADALLEEKLEGMGAVLVEGPKWCGKTTTSEQHAQSILYLDDPKNRQQNLQLADVNPEMLLQGGVPRLIDEWQLAPTLWDAVRFVVDHRNEEGQFILTGSAVPLNVEDKTQISHTGTGRIARLRMRTMSLWESGESNGSVSLQQLINDSDHIAGINPLSIDDIAFLVCRGGWPRATFQTRKIALGRAFDYYDAVVNQDLQRIDDVLRSTERVKLLMRSYSRLQGTQTSLCAICDNMKSHDDNTLDDRTVAAYIHALKKIFVIEDMPAWNPNLRSKTAIRTSDTRYFSDSSIAVAALGLCPADLINDLHTFGLLFETMCVRDLRVYADALGGTVYHYRDKDGLECDAVLHFRNGTYMLVEIKLGGDKLVEEGATSLLKLAQKIDTDKMKSPLCLIVLTGTGNYAYKRKDGVCIIPIGCLKN